MLAKKKRTRRRALAHSRPPMVAPSTSVSRKVTRTIIRTHHTLEKRKAKSLAEGDETAAAIVQEEILSRGGIKTYQRASLLGQGHSRGGDSSKVLIDWLKPFATFSKARKEKAPLRLLEVGALSTSNACSKCGVFDIERIDLNSQTPGITQQDFMARPLPKNFGDKFEIISLSLVLNYVSDPVGRGEMLKRCIKFLRIPATEQIDNLGLATYFPSLFLVLPSPCLTNSRYLDEDKLEDIMKSLGYEKIQQKWSSKLVYYLWRATELAPVENPSTFKKVEVRPGKLRNNFSIVIK